MADKTAAQIILELIGKDVSASKGIQTVIDKIKEFANIALNFDKLLLASSNETTAGIGKNYRKLTEDERKEIAARIQALKDSNEAAKKDFKVLSDSKTAIDKEYRDRVKRNIQEQADLEKKVAQDTANALKKQAQDTANQAIMAKKGITPLEKSEIQETAKLQKAEAQRLAEAQIKDIQLRATAEKRNIDEINKKIIEEGRTARKILADIDKQDLEAKKAFAKKIQDAINQQQIDGIKKAQEAQKQAALVEKQTLAQPGKDIESKINALRLERKEINDNINALNQLKASVKGESEEELKFKRSVQDSLETLKNRRLAINEDITQLNRQKAALTDSKISQDSSNKATKESIEELKKQRQALQDTSTQTKTASDHYNNLGGVIWQVRASFHALTDILGNLINMPFLEWSREADKNLRNFNSIGLLTEEQFRETTDAVLDMTSEEGLNGLKDMTKSLFNLYSAGYQGAEALNILNESNLTAKAGLATTDEVLKGTIATLHAYSLGSEETARIQGIMLKGVQDGVYTLSEYVNGIGQAISFAPEFKKANGETALSIEQITAALVTTTRSGLSMQNSIVAINQLLKSFMDPAVHSAKLAEQLGINLSASAFEAKNFGEVIADVLNKTGSGSEQQSFISALFGESRALKGFFKLAKDDAKFFTKELREIENGADKAREVALEEQRKSYDQHLEQLKTRWEVSMKSFFNIAVGPMNGILKFLGDIVQGFNDLPQPIKDVIATLGILTFVVGSLGAAAITAAIGWGILTRALSIATVGIGLSTAATISLKAALLALFQTIGLVGGAISGSVLLFYGFNKAADAYAEITRKNRWETDKWNDSIYSQIDLLGKLKNAFEAEKAEAQAKKDEQRNEDAKEDSLKRIVALRREEAKLKKENKTLSPEQNRDMAVNLRNLATNTTDNDAKTRLRDEAKLYEDNLNKFKLSEKKKTEVTMAGIKAKEKADEEYEQHHKTLENKIFKDTHTRYENELEDIKNEFAAEKELLQNKVNLGIAADKELVKNSDKSAKEKKKLLDDLDRQESGIRSQLKVLDSLESKARAKAWNEEQERRRTDNKRIKDERTKNTKDELAGLVYDLEQKINEEEKNEKHSKAVKLKIITEYLQEEANLYRKYSVRPELEGKEGKALGKKAGDIESDIKKQITKFELETIQDKIDAENKYHEISMKNIENKGVFNKSTEDEILNDKIFSDSQYILKLKAFLKEDEKSHKLTADQKLDIETNLANATLSVTEKTQKRIDVKRAEEVSIRDNEIEKRRVEIQLLSDLEIDTKETTNKKLFALNQEELENEREKLFYLKKNSPNDTEAIRQQETKVQVIRNEAKLITKRNEKETNDYIKALADDLYNHRVQNINNELAANKISSFEAREQIREANIQKIKDLRELLTTQKKEIDKNKTEQEINNLQSANVLSLKEDSKEVLGTIQNINSAIGSMGDILQSSGNTFSKVFGGMISDAAKLTSSLFNLLGAIATKGDVIGGVLDIIGKVATSVFNIQANAEAKAEEIKNRQLEYDKNILQSGIQTTEKKLQLIKKEKEQAISAADFIYEHSRKTVYDAVALHDTKREADRKYSEDKKQIEKDALKLSRDLEIENARIHRANEEDKLENRIKTLDEEKKLQEEAARESLTNEKDKAIKLDSINQDYLNKKHKLEEDDKKKQEQDRKDEEKRIKSLAEYKIKIARLFNKEQNASELEELQEKYQKEVEYIDENFKDEATNADLKKSLFSQMEVAKTQIIQENEQKRRDILRKSHDDIIKWADEEIDKINQKYKTEADKIQSNIDSIKSKYKTEIDRINEIEKLLGKEELDIATQQGISKTFKSDLDKAIAAMKGSQYRLTDEEFEKKTKREDLSLSNANLEGLSVDERVKREKEVALGRIAYLQEYQSRFDSRSKESIEFSYKIQAEKERFFNAEKTRLEANAEKNKLEGELYFRKQEKQTLVANMDLEIKNAIKLDAERNISERKIIDERKQITSNFNSGMVDAAKAFNKELNNGLNDALNKIKETAKNTVGATANTTTPQSTYTTEANTMARFYETGGYGNKTSTSNLTGSVAYENAPGFIGPARLNTTQDKPTLLKILAGALGISEDRAFNEYYESSVDSIRALLHSKGVRGFGAGGISSGPKTGYPIIAHDEELHLNKNQGDNLAYLFKLANMPKPDIKQFTFAGGGNSTNNIQVINDFSEMKVSSDMDLKKVCTYIDTSINNAIRKIR